MDDNAKILQDMPPKGGYANVEWKRVMPKKFMSGYKTFALFGLITGTSFAVYKYEVYLESKRRIEENDSRVALSPLLEAERDRMLLKQLRINRDEEKELMKNVPGWKVGTFWGKPVYHNIACRFPPVFGEDVYTHNRLYDLEDRMLERKRH